jgi:hypothetical protein
MRFRYGRSSLGPTDPCEITSQSFEPSDSQLLNEYGEHHTAEIPFLGPTVTIIPSGNVNMVCQVEVSSEG